MNNSLIKSKLKIPLKWSMYFSLIVLPMLFGLVGCQQNKEQPQEDKKQTVVAQPPIEKPKPKPEKEDFTLFSQKFFSDKAFQLSRIIFPVREVSDYEYKINKDYGEFIEKSDWKFERNSNVEFNKNDHMYASFPGSFYTNVRTKNGQMYYTIKYISKFANEELYKYTYIFKEKDYKWYLITKTYIEYNP